MMPLRPPLPGSAPATPARRRVLAGAAGLCAGLAAPAWLTPALARTHNALNLTPSQTEGPFYPVSLPADTDFDLLRNGTAPEAPGQVTWLTGTVTDTRGRPLTGGVVEIWQCDHLGHYHHPGNGNRADPAFQGFGRVTLGRDGRYRFRTLRPVPYTGRTPHIHAKVRLDRQELLTTQLYVQGDPGNARDVLWRRLGPEGQAALTRPFTPGPDGLQADFPLVVRP